MLHTLGARHFHGGRITGAGMALYALGARASRPPRLVSLHSNCSSGGGHATVWLWWTGGRRHTLEAREHPLAGRRPPSSCSGGDGVRGAMKD
jgi:hypothetical protein